MIYAYRDKYDGKIDHEFYSDKDYEKFQTQQLEEERVMIRDKLNTLGVPDTLKVVCIKFCELLEAIAAKAGNRFVNLNTFGEKVEGHIKNKEFDADFEQLVLENPQWFGQTPLTRIAFKLSNIGVETVMSNSPHFQSSIPNGAPPKVSMRPPPGDNSDL